MYAYFNNGLSLRSVDADYEAQSGEVLFADVATSDQLAEAFAGYSSALTVENRQDLVRQAQAALDRTDMVAIRCIKAGVNFPETWQNYTAQLRAFVNGVGDSLPIQPDEYPEGT